MAKAPPRTNRKLGAEARAELGHDRTCVECGDTKTVSASTFTPYNKGKRGWKEVCKVCENLTRTTPIKAPANHRDGTIEDAILEMYDLKHDIKGDKSRLDELQAMLGQRVRDLGYTEEGFRLFVEIVKPLVSGWMEPGSIHDDIIAGLMSQHRRRLIIATRYSAKSTLTSVYVAWRLFQDPLLKVMVISRGAKLAARMLRTVRQVFFANCPMLEHLVPNEDCLDNAEQFQTPQSVEVTTGGASLTSLGVTSNLPGFRADLTISDDVEGPKDNTPEKVENLEEVLNELHMINPKGEKVMLGTYQSEYSIYAKLADLGTTETGATWELHRACMFEEDVVDGEKVLHSRWPGMFTDKDAMDWRRSVTERAWRLHAMLICDPDILNDKPLKIKQFLLVNRPAKDKQFPMVVEAGGVEAQDVPTWGAPKGDVWYTARLIGSETAHYASVVMAVDPASGLAGRDAIGVAVLGITASGQGVVRHLEGVRGIDKLANIRRVAQLAAFFEVTQLVVEELADGLFGETLEGQLNLLNFPMMVEKVTTGGQQKGRRIIETLAPPLAAGRLIMLESVARSDHGGEFTNQLVRISYDGRTGAAKDHDDIVDALAHAVGASKGSLVSDTADNIGEHHAAKMDNWRGVPMRFGGLGVDQEEVGNSRNMSIDGFQEGTLGERLLEEDVVLVQYEARLAALQETVRTDMSTGRRADRRIRAQIVKLREIIKDLKELQVL